MKKTIAILLAVLLMVGLCACGESNAEDIAFKNDLDSELHGVHITDSSESEWGDPLNYAKLSAGSTIYIDFAKFAGESGLYDIGLIDGNSVNYDVYEVTLNIGDKVTISGNADGATLIVKSADGSEKSYDVIIY